MAKKQFQPNGNTKRFISLYNKLYSENKFKSGADLIRLLGENPDTYKGTLSQALKSKIDIPTAFYLKFCNHFALGLDDSPITEKTGMALTKDDAIRQLNDRIDKLENTVEVIKRLIILSQK